MHKNPFQLFQQFSDQLCIGISAHEEISDEHAAATLDAQKYVSLWQVHGAVSIIARGPVQRDVQADGVATNERGLALTVRWADCQNFVFFAPEHNVVSVLHAGWRGLIAGAIPAHLQLLADEWNISPTECFVGAGPSLCMQCADFTNPIVELPTIDPAFIDGRHVNLQGVADAQLDAAGVPRPQRERSADCTRCTPEKYWTYRGGHREEVAAGKSNLLLAVLL